MIKRLEQVAALVVAAGLAIVSYWLFFSWAQGGGADQRQRRTHHFSEPASGLDQPLFTGRIVQGADVRSDFVSIHGQSDCVSDVHNVV